MGGRRGHRSLVTPASEIGIAKVRFPLPRPGDVVRIGRAANYLYQGRFSFEMRIIKLIPEPVVPGIAWVHGYELARTGRAVRRRTVLVRTAGLIYTWSGEQRTARAAASVSTLP